MRRRGIPGRVCRRSPERTAETPCRTGDADHPRVDSHRPLARGEDEAVAVRQQRRGAARLCARTLLDEEELAAGVVDARFAEVDHDLQRKHQVAVEIPVQRVPVALAVLEQDRGRLLLTCLVAHVQPVVEVVGPGWRAAQLGPPVPGDRQQPRVQRLLERLDRLGIGLLEVPVLALAEPVSGACRSSRGTGGRRDRALGSSRPRPW